MVTSANVACGFHAGDPRTLLRTVTAAAARGVVVGAQVSYPDLVGFGRREMDLAAEDVTADVLYQVGALAGIARAAGTAVAYVKPHGALYHRVARDPVTAGALAEAVLRYDPALPVLLLAGSAGLEVVRAAGLTGVGECFADRGYTPDGGLLPRGEPGAVLTDPVEVADPGGPDGHRRGGRGGWQLVATGRPLHVSAWRHSGRRGAGPRRPRRAGRRLESSSPRSSGYATGWVRGALGHIGASGPPGTIR